MGSAGGVERFGPLVALLAERNAVLCDVAAVWHCGPIRDVMRVELLALLAARGAAVPVSSENRLAKVLANLFLLLAHAPASVAAHCLQESHRSALSFRATPQAAAGTG